MINNMNGDGAESLSAEGVRRPRLRIRWSSNLQNLRFELESTRGQLKSLAKVVESDKRGEEILNRCQGYLDDAEIAFKRILPRQLFVWQMLFLIQQNLLLIMPTDELDAKWHALQKRLERNAKVKGECLRKQAFLDDIRQQLQSRERLDDGQSHDIRNKMMQVRKSLDDLVIVDLWQNMQILRYTVTFLVLGGFLMVALLVFVMLSFQMHDSTSGNGCACTAVGMTLAGAFGAVLSALTPGKSFVVTGIPLLTAVSAVRPVIGAASGFFLYLVYVAGFPVVANVDNVVELYVLAVGFGFSERALFNLLGGIAGKSDSTIGARFS